MNRYAGLAAILVSFSARSVLPEINAAAYYVDAQSGDDASSGATPQRPWKSLLRVNRQIFQAGDKLFFKADREYAGQLRPQGSGMRQNGQAPLITISHYGPGPRPRIAAGGHYLDAVLLRNVEGYELEGLEITNHGTNREPWRTGVRVVADGGGLMRHIHLRDLFVHDVNGDLSKDQEGCGIYFESRGGNNSRFQDLVIEQCHVVRTDRNGICQRTSNGTRSLGVVIRSNLLEDIGGDGIKVWGSDGAIIESNALHGGRRRCDDGAAGIWPFDSDDTLIQFNEVSGMKGIKDGQGFDSDFLCRRSLFQYNYSHDNEGGFMLICAPGNSYNEDTVIRYNISQGDGINSARVFHFGGAATNTLVYNNTIYLGPAQSLPLVLFSEWEGGKAHGAQFLNNIFYVEGAARVELGKANGTVFRHNLFYGQCANLPADPDILTDRPALPKPGSGGRGFGSLAGYQWSGPTGRFSGQPIESNGGRDFFGQPVPPGQKPTVGASESVP
ncbi:MAG: right-handed parallel beta-helix repeat-containing protein [Verrucomicrobiota bacterium]